MWHDTHPYNHKVLHTHYGDPTDPVVVISNEKYTGYPEDMENKLTHFILFKKNPVASITRRACTLNFSHFTFPNLIIAQTMT